MNLSAALNLILLTLTLTLNLTLNLNPTLNLNLTPAVAFQLSSRLRLGLRNLLGAAVSLQVHTPDPCDTVKGG